MIMFSELSEIFKGTAFTEAELKRFYYSVKKSVILVHLGKRSWPELFKLEESCQWPVLQKIGDPKLPIYMGADKALLDKFIRTISEEKVIRQRKSSTDKVRYWSLLQALIQERTDLFIHIFGFDGNDVKYCETISERYSRMIERRASNKKKMWQIGIGAGAATIAGAAAIWYMSKKDKK